MFAKYLTLSVTITVFISSVPLQRRLITLFFPVHIYNMPQIFLDKSFELTNFECYQEREKYKLVDPQSYHYLNQSNCYELVDIDDAQFYLSTRRAMTVIGISEIEQVCPFDLNLLYSIPGNNLYLSVS